MINNRSIKDFKVEGNDKIFYKKIQLNNMAYLKDNACKSHRNRSTTPENEQSKSNNVPKTTNNSFMKKKQENSKNKIIQKNKSISQIKDFIVNIQKGIVSDSVKKQLQGKNAAPRVSVVSDNKKSFNQNLMENFNRYKANKISSRNSSMKKRL